MVDVFIVKRLSLFEKMLDKVKLATNFPALKIKLTGNDDILLLQRIREITERKEDHQKEHLKIDFERLFYRHTGCGYLKI